MNVEFNDFIGVFEDAYPKEFCENIINNMDRAFELGFGNTRQSSEGVEKHVKTDTHLYFSNVISYEQLANQDSLSLFNSVFWDVCYPQYAAEYSALKDMDPHYSNGVKLQKTKVGEGYHVWHCEHGAKESKRLLSYIVYLNDVDEGGETEFLYQHKRFKPKQGTLVLWPAGFTHTHRGNPPLSNTKYIMTGWIEF